MLTQGENLQDLLSLLTEILTDELYRKWHTIALSILLGAVQLGEITDSKSFSILWDASKEFDWDVRASTITAMSDSSEGRAWLKTQITKWDKNIRTHEWGNVARLAIQEREAEIKKYQEEKSNGVIKQ